MNIGVDLDGTLISFNNWFDVINTGNKLEFKGKSFLSYALFAKPINNVVDELLSLKNNGNKIYLITARKYVKEKSLKGKISKFLLEFWLSQNMIDCFDTIVFCQDKNEVEEKKQACKDLSIDVMLEDNPFIIDGLVDSNIEVIYVSQPYNKNSRGIAVNSIQDAFNMVKEM